MGSNERSATNRRRAESFGAVAETYDRVRPSYPAALIDELVAGGVRAALDVGCGTGQVARLLAARGLSVLGVEVDERMAALARLHGVAVELAAFEAWDPAGREFDLITCGQAWHWLDPVAAPVKAVALLRPGGRIGLLWNFVEFAASLNRDLDAAYERTAPQLTRASVLRGGGPATIDGHVAELAASGRFEPADVRTYKWVRPYSRADWLALIASHSDHSTLPAAQLGALLDAVGVVIDEHGGEIDAHYVTYAVIARRH